MSCGQRRLNTFWQETILKSQIEQSLDIDTIYPTIVGIKVCLIIHDFDISN